MGSHTISAHVVRLFVRAAGAPSAGSMRGASEACLSPHTPILTPSLAQDMDWTNCEHHACSEVRAAALSGGSGGSAAASAPTRLHSARRLLTPPCAPATAPPPPPFSLPPGDCNFKMEFLRGNWGIREQFKKCVQRRAELSVAMNPYCGQARAEAAVRAVLDRCLRDTAPFDRIP